MIEDSIPTFQTFCEHQDVGTLVADQDLSKQYEEVVRYYASFAGNPPSQAKGQLSAPVAIRWKAAGLQALKSVSSSEAVGAGRGRQLEIILPVLLENLYSNSEDRLHSLNQKANAEKESAMRRRMSIVTVRTSESVPEPSNDSISATTADADRLAIEEAELIALQSLKQIFTANNRVQIRLATTSMLKFLMEKPRMGRPGTAKTAKSGRAVHWPTMLVEMVTRWTPVQDRFIIIVTAMETLVKSTTTEENMEKQLTLAGLVESLLGSTINMIGLSIMDVLLGLIQHILLLLQLGGKEPTYFRTTNRQMRLISSENLRACRARPRSWRNKKGMTWSRLPRRLVPDKSCYLACKDASQTLPLTYTTAIKSPT